MNLRNFHWKIRAAMDSLEALQNLQKDLSIFNEARLPVLERLTAELEAQLDDFRQLLSTPSKSDESRKKIQSGRTRRCLLLEDF